MIKKFALKLRTRFALKKNIVRKSIPFTSAKKIGVLVNGDIKEKQAVNNFIDSLTSEGKEVQVLCFTKPPKKKEKPKKLFPFRHDTFSIKDFKAHGGFGSKKINNFVKTDFDYLFSLNTSPFLPFETILASCEAKCRIGSFLEEKESFYELMVHGNKKGDLSSILEQMIFFTKKIDNNEG
ncbi:MAG: hypothetical protein GY827_01140 [Cytophagales bacterium]|nr:hypothetical protein [Cytophagales bacterium]